MAKTICSRDLHTQIGLHTKFYCLLILSSEGTLRKLHLVYGTLGRECCLLIEKYQTELRFNELNVAHDWILTQTFLTWFTFGAIQFSGLVAFGTCSTRLTTFITGKSRKRSNIFIPLCYISKCKT